MEFLTQWYVLVPIALIVQWISGYTIYSTLRMTPLQYDMLVRRSPLSVKILTITYLVGQLTGLMWTFTIFLGIGSETIRSVFFGDGWKLYVGISVDFIIAFYVLICLFLYKSKPSWKMVVFGYGRKSTRWVVTTLWLLSALLFVFSTIVVETYF